MALPYNRLAQESDILYEPQESYQAPLTLPADIASRSPLEKAAYYNQLIDQGYNDAAIRQAAGQQTDSDWSALQGLASGLRAPAPAPAAVTGPSNADVLTGLYQDVLGRAPDAGGFGFWLNAMNDQGYTPEMVRQQFLASPEYQARQATTTGALAQAVAPTPATAPTPAATPDVSKATVPETPKVTPLEPPAEERPESKPIVDVAPEYVAPNLYRTPGGNYINSQGYPVDAAEAQRIISGGAAPAPAPAAQTTTASALQQAASASPQSLFTSLLGADPKLADQLRANYNQAFNQGEASTFYDAGIQVGDYTLRSMPIGYDFAGERQGGGFQASKTATNDRGLPLETTYTYDDNGNITGAEVRYFTGSDSGVTINFDAQGNKIGERGFDYSEQWKGVVAPLVSMAAMAFAGPVAQSLGAVLGGGTATLASEIAANAIVRGGLGAAQAGLTGGDVLKGALTGAATGALGAGGASLANAAAAETLNLTGSQIAADAVRGAVQSGLNAVPGVIASGGNLGDLARAGLVGGVTSGAGSAIGSALEGTGVTTGQVSAGIRLAQELSSGKPNISAIANAAAGLVNNPNAMVAAKAVSLLDTIQRAGSNPAAWMGVMEAANQLSSAVERASVPKGLSDAATAAFINAKRTGATDDEAAAAAQAVSGGTVAGISRLPGTAPTSTTKVTGENLGTVGPANLDIGDITSIELPRAPTQEELNASIANGINNAATFEDAYASARNLYGAGKTFTWQGKSYSTDTRQENPALAEASDAARQAATGAGAGRGTLGGMTAAEAANLLSVPLRTTPAATGNQVFDTAQYDALGNLIGGTAYNTEGVDTSTGLGRVGNVAANVINTAAGMVGTYGPSAVQAGANLISNVGGIIDLAAGRSTDAGNFLRNSADRITNFVDTISDPEVKAGQQRIGDAIDAADGFVNKVLALGKSMAKDPVSAFNWMLTEGFEEVPGVGLAVKVGNKLGRHGKLSGYGIMGVSILNDAVESGGSAYNDTYQNALKEGLTESQARAAARNSALASMLATGVTQGVVEGKLLSKAIGRETIGEGVEGAAQSAAAQYAVTGTVDPNKVIKDALIEASVGKGASTSATGLTGAGGTAAATTAPATTAATSGATTGATTGTTSTGGISTLTGTTTSGVSVTGGDISTAGTGPLDAASIINDYVSTVLQSGGTGQDVNASIGSAVNSAVSSGADAASSVVAATNAAANAGTNTAAATNAAVNAANAAGANVSVSGGVVTSNQTTGGVTTKSSVDTNTGQSQSTSTNQNTGTTTQTSTDSNTGISQSTSTNTNTGTTTNTQTNTNTGNSTATQTNANTNTTTQTDTNANTNTSTTTAVNNNTNTSTTTQVDGNTNTSTTTQVSGNTTTTTQVNSNTGVSTTTAVDANTGVNTTTTVDGNTSTTVKTDPNTNTTTTTTVDTNTNTSTTVTTNTDTGVVVNTTADPVSPVKPVDPVPPVKPPAPPPTPPVTPPQPPVTPPTPPVAPPVSPPVAPPSAVPASRTSVPSGGLLPAMMAAGQLPNLAPQFLESRVTQGYVDPLAKVRQAQAELERDTMMQNIDPRLMQILSERMGAPSGGLEQASNQPHYTYGEEDSIDDILGGHAANYAKGGYVQPLMAKEGGMSLPLLAKAGGLPAQKHGREDFKDGKHVAGEGDGQSDDIPAWLADGEFVFPADVVSALGNGSTKAGTDKLYEMMHSIRARARSKGPKDLPPPALKSPLDYLKSKK